MDIARLLSSIAKGAGAPLIKRQVLDDEREAGRPPRTHGLPFEWDRPNKGLYADGQIRIVWKDKDGEILHCRLATDEEVKYIMLYEMIRDALFVTR